jgi:hypothetical protein
MMYVLQSIFSGSDEEVFYGGRMLARQSFSDI